MRPYVRDFRPVLVAVDGGAEALMEEGWKPDVIVGDMDSVTDATLRCGAEILVHAYREGHAPGEERLRSLGVPFQTVAAPGISEDIAMLLAHERGAELIVAVGTHFNLVEFLERSRAGHVVDVRDAAEGGRDPGRRQGGLAARQPADRSLAARRCSASPRSPRSSSRCSRHRRCGTSSASRLAPCSTFATTSPRSRPSS